MNNSVNSDQTASEHDKKCRPWSDCWEWQTVQTLIRLLRIANSVDPDQTAVENDSVDPDQTVPENNSVDLDFDQTAESGK